MSEPEYVIVQPGLDGVAWLGEVIGGELSPIGKIGDLLNAPKGVGEVEREHEKTLAIMELALDQRDVLASRINRALSKHEHADTCGSVLSPTENYACTCWRAALTGDDA